MKKLLQAVAVSVCVLVLCAEGYAGIKSGGSRSSGSSGSSRTSPSPTKSRASTPSPPPKKSYDSDAAREQRKIESQRSYEESQRRKAEEAKRNQPPTAPPTGTYTGRNDSNRGGGYGGSNGGTTIIRERDSSPSMPWIVPVPVPTGDNETHYHYGNGTTPGNGTNVAYSRTTNGSGVSGWVCGIIGGVLILGLVVWYVFVRNRD